MNDDLEPTSPEPSAPDDERAAERHDGSDAGGEVAPRSDGNPPSAEADPSAVEDSSLPDADDAPQSPVDAVAASDVAARATTTALDAADLRHAWAYLRLAVEAERRAAEPHIVWEHLLGAERMLARAEGKPPPTQPTPAERLETDVQEARRNVDVLQTRLASALGAPDQPTKSVPWMAVAGALGIVVLLVGIVWGIVSARARHDLGAGKSWEASSAWGTASLRGTLGPGQSQPFFHTAEENDPYVDIDLGASRRVTRVEVVNRSDFGAERAIPLTIWVGASRGSMRQVAKRDQSFETWNAVLPAGTDARWVRVRAVRKTFLHLDDVRIY